MVIVIRYGPAKLSSDYRNYPVGTDLGYGVDSYSLYLVNYSLYLVNYSLYLVNAALGCTGS